MNYAALQPVYALNFVNDIFQKDVDDYYHYYHLAHDRLTHKVIDGLTSYLSNCRSSNPTLSPTGKCKYCGYAS